jgi:hypothetical protein
MALPHALQQVTKRPGMYFSPVNYDTAAAFLQGFDVANSGAALTGFREWLVLRVGCGNNLAWSELVLRLAFPDAESPRKCLSQSGNQKQATELLFGLLDEFWHQRETHQGLRRIYLCYQEWLRRQDWYGPSSPDYIADCPG